jgi:hypothetical protein
VLPGKIVFPSSSAYDSSISSYYSATAAGIRPQCIVTPETAEDVSLAIHTLTSTSRRHGGDKKEACKFAVRSGGHGSIPDSANIEGGVTIDLRELNSIDVNVDAGTVSVGAGNTWGSVYTKLDEVDLSVVGGRGADIGVGGLVLGGGVSYFSPRYGWASDMVQDFEVVLANGSIIHANDRENPDLLWALRGGSNNFAIVTKLELQTFKQGTFWGGHSFHQGSTWAENIREFAKISSKEPYDEFAHIITSLSFTNGAVAIANHLDYTKPGATDPPIFDAIRKIPSIFNTLRATKVSGLAEEMKGVQTFGQRYVSTSWLMCMTAANHLQDNYGLPSL